MGKRRKKLKTWVHSGRANLHTRSQIPHRVQYDPHKRFSKVTSIFYCLISWHMNCRTNWLWWTRGVVTQCYQLDLCVNSFWTCVQKMSLTCHKPWHFTLKTQNVIICIQRCQTQNDSSWISVSIVSRIKRWLWPLTFGHQNPITF